MCYCTYSSWFSFKRYKDNLIAEKHLQGLILGFNGEPSYLQHINAGGSCWRGRRLQLSRRRQLCFENTDKIFSLLDTFCLGSHFSSGVSSCNPYTTQGLIQVQCIYLQSWAALLISIIWLMFWRSVSTEKLNTFYLTKALLFKSLLWSVRFILFHQVQVKERPPMHEYIRKLLYKDLSKTTTEKVLRQMRKLPWDEPGVSFVLLYFLFVTFKRK